MVNLAGTAVRFLRLTETRDLEAAGKLLAPDVRFIAPGGAVFNGLGAYVAGRSTRYRSIHKEIAGTHTADAGAGRTAVYVFGTLRGIALNGDPISGVRFIDRLTFADDRIVLHEVWNDLAL